MGELLIIAAVIGLLPAAIASRKGRSFFGWWIIGFLLFIIALPAAILAQDERLRECPFCAEAIQPEAVVCPHCQRDLAEHPAPPLRQRRSGRLTV